MPQYFFHVHDGSSALDTEGSELSDIYTAQAEAVRMCGEILKEMGARFWDGAGWRLEVTDDVGQTLFICHFSGEERLQLLEPAI